MGWSVGYDGNWGRDIGYGVPAYCDHPDCNEEIDRGIAHVCGGRPYGGDSGCGLYFCAKHLTAAKSLCERCSKGAEPFTPKDDHIVWVEHKLTDPSWQKWRDQNQTKVADMRKKCCFK